MRALLAAGLVASIFASGSINPLVRAAAADDRAAESAPPPAAREIHPVSSLAELERAVAAARPGDHVVLKDGSYEGGLVLSRSFPAGAPLVVRAESVLGARVKGGWDVDGSGYVLSGIAWEGTGSGVRVKGSDVRLTRCAVRDTGGGDRGARRAAVAVANKRGETTRAVTIDRCEFAGYGRGVVVAPDGAIEDVLIERNHFRGEAQAGKGRRGSAVDLGVENGHRERSVRARVQYNYFEGPLGGHVVHVKSSDNLIAFNTVVRGGGRRAVVSVRHGRGNRVLGNDLGGDGRITTYDYGTQILGNRTGEIWLQAGNRATGYSYDGLPNKREAGYSTRPASRGARVAGNAGALLIGQHFDAYCEQEPTPVAAAAVYRHEGPVRFAEEGCATWHEDVTVEAGAPPPAEWGGVPALVRLSVDEVGPSAR